MTRGILIVGDDAPLTTALMAEAAKRVERFASVIIPNRISGPDSEMPDFSLGAADRLTWNPSSPISARTLILAAENRLEHIDDAVLVCSPPAVCCLPEKLVLREIETMVNDHIIGWFYLVKELTAKFRSRQSGSLSLIVAETGPAGKGKDSLVDLLGPAAAASFRAFAQSLLSAAFNEPFYVFGFSSTEQSGDPEFCSFLFKIIDERNKRDNGKWHKHGKFSFFK
ncbi:MAG: hypothetical protein LBP76_07070 [Treponema sp.]|jgi:hypothetical protein|nr:hypothetical protein [Treponema sp.]